MGMYKNRNFGFGMNTDDAEHVLADPYLTIAKNITVGSGYMETRPGLTLWNQDLTKSGGVTMMCPAYFRGGTKVLVFANDDDYYSLPNTAATDTAWTSIGDYGTAVDNPYAYFYQNQIAFGTGSTANTPKRWDGTTFSTVTTKPDSSSDIRFYQYHQGANAAYLFGAGNERDNASHNNSILYYTSDIDNWGSGGTINVGTNDGQKITGIASHGNIIVYKDFSKYRLDIVYESNSGTNVLRVLEKYNDGGAVNHETIQVALNDILALSGRPGEGVRGFAQTQTKLGGSESRRYSTKISKYMKLINWQHVKARARSIVWDEKIFIAVPISGSSTNNVVFVGHLNEVTDIGEIPWTVYDWQVGSFAIFQDSNGVEQLLIGDANQPKIYVFDEDSLSDNSSNITAQARTKKFDLGNLEIDTLNYILLAGQISELTQLRVKVYVDGRESTYIIDSDQILSPTSYIWSHVVGSEIVGGTATDASKPRFLAILPIPDSHRHGSEVQIDFFSQGQGYYWKIDYLSINEPLNYRKFPDAHWVSQES